MVDVNKLLGQFMNSGAATGFAGGLAGGLTSSMLTSKAGRKLGKSALKVGGIAAVGALAYSAYKRYQDKQIQANAPVTHDVLGSALQTPPRGSAFLPLASNEEATNALGLTLIRAMIAASRADGTLDGRESLLIYQKIEAMQLDEPTSQMLVHEMNHPVDMDRLIQAATSPEIAAEIYVASRLVINQDNPAARGYLAMLAARLNLPKGLAKEIDQQITTADSIAA